MHCWSPQCLTGPPWLAQSTEAVGLAVCHKKGEKLAQLVLGGKRQALAALWDSGLLIDLNRLKTC